MRSKKAKGKYLAGKAKGKSVALAFDLKLEIGNWKEKIFRIYFCLLPFAFCLLLYAAAFCLLLSCAEAQEKRDYTLFNGTRVYFSLDTDAPDTPSHLASRIQVSDLNSINRIVVDQKSGIFFGYTLKVEPIGSSNKYRVFLQPLSNEQVQKIKGSKWYEQAQIVLDPKRKNTSIRPNAATSQSGRKPPPAALTPVTRYPPPQTIDDSDSIAVDVLINPTTGTKLTDRITISSKDLPALATNKNAARDFTLNDLQLEVSGYRVFVNNQIVTEDKPFGGCGGSLIWLYIPKHGRFIFSIAPREGYDFQKIGTVEDNKILFTANGNFYEWRSQNPVIRNGGKWNLWVLQDTAYQPEQSEKDVAQNCCLHGAAGNMASLFSPAVTTQLPSKNKIIRKHQVEPNLLAPELYADELLIKHMLVDLPGASLPDSKWEVHWQLWFIPEAEEKRVQEELIKAVPSNATGVKTFAWNPRPENYPNKIALGSGLFLQSGFAQLKDRINIGNALAFKAKIPEHLQTKFASLMISYNVKIFDAQLNRTITRTGIWMTKPFDDDPNNPLRSIPRTMLHSNWYVTASGEVFTSQEPRRTNSTKWVEEE